MPNKNYSAGLCNIGEKEVAVRQKLLLFSLIGVVAFTVVIHFLHSLIICFLILMFTFTTVLLFIEIRTGFCIFFGIFKLHNFKHLGNLDSVDDKHCCHKDRMKAMRIIFFALLLSLPYAWMVYKMTA